MVSAMGEDLANGESAEDRIGPPAHCREAEQQVGERVGLGSRRVVFSRRAKGGNVLVQRGIQKNLLNAVTRCTKPLESSALCEQTSVPSVCSRALEAAVRRVHQGQDHSPTGRIAEGARMPPASR